ncbi:MAG: UPF0179 family protein [Thermoplasmata archaeon]
MVEVTLIGEKLAKKGLKFVFGGCLSRCQNCEIKISCCGLDKNKRYKIVGVRDNVHNCKVHADKVKVVEVEEIPLRTTLQGTSLIEGSLVSLKEKKCSDIDCENYRLCFPAGIEPSGKYHLEKLCGTVECPKGYKLKEVLLV